MTTTVASSIFPAAFALLNLICQPRPAPAGYRPFPAQHRVASCAKLPPEDGTPDLLARRGHGSMPATGGFPPEKCSDGTSLARMGERAFRPPGRKPSLHGGASNVDNPRQHRGPVFFWTRVCYWRGQPLPKALSICGQAEHACISRFRLCYCIRLITWLSTANGPPSTSVTVLPYGDQPSSMPNGSRSPPVRSA